MDYINESGKRSGYVDNIVKSCGHIYAHLMKIISKSDHSQISTKWIDTIFEQNRQLLNITNKGYWIDASQQIKLTKIQRKAIDEYEDGGNKNGLYYYNIVLSYFPDIKQLQDRERLLRYILSKLVPGQDDKYIETAYRDYNKD